VTGQFQFVYTKRESVCNINLFPIEFSVLVLDAGKIKEFDAPKVLLSSKGSTLRSMIEAT
jgi:hypothetical protein